MACVYMACSLWGFGKCGHFFVWFHRLTRSLPEYLNMVGTLMQPLPGTFKAVLFCHQFETKTHVLKKKKIIRIFNGSIFQYMTSEKYSAWYSAYFNFLSQLDRMVTLCLCCKKKTSLFVLHGRSDKSVFFHLRSRSYPKVSCWFIHIKTFLHKKKII